MTTRADRAAQALAIIRLVNGAGALLAPQLVLRRFGAGPGDRAGVYPLRMFGIRTVVLGADLLVRGRARSRADWAGVVIHATDTLAAAHAGLRGHLPRRTATALVLVSSTNTCLAVITARG